jgi:D-alanyl-D-alanine carboxypeptidase/D-alanyl-D-alanine-endopeptidase (penicillin-binding protein 4)
METDPSDPVRASERVSELWRVRADLVIIACVTAGGTESYYDLGGLGVHGVVTSTSLPKRIRGDVDAAFASARAGQVERFLDDTLPAPGPAAVAWAIEHAGPRSSVDRLSAALGHTPRSLRDTCQASGLPSPSKVLLWGRLIQAGARLGDDGRRLEDVAFSLGYATSTSLARAMKLHTGLTPTEISERGGMTAVLDALLEKGRRSGRGGGPSAQRTAMARLSTIVGAVLLSGCATLGFGGSGVDRSRIEDVLEEAPFDQLHIGVYAVDAVSGRTLFAHNERRKFIPASNQKILVTATAMSLLGPQHRFRTDVWATGPIEGSFLDGDVVVVGSGDPSFSDRYWPSGTAALDAIADSLHAQGVKYVAGAFRLDASAWDSSTVGPTWEVEDLRYGYGATGGVFAIDEGEMEVIVSGGPAVGFPAEVSWSPVGTEEFVRSHVRTAPKDSATRVRPDYLPETRQIVLEGDAELGAVDTLSFAMRDPVRQAAAVLARAFSTRGLEVEGGWEVVWAKGDPLGRSCHAGKLSKCEGARTLFTTESPPLADLAAGILKPSQNWMTEQLVRALGARFGDEGSWDEGIDVIEAYLINEVGVAPLDIAARDGSGLSFYNLITPRALVHILRDMHLGPHAAAYRSALAEPGEEDSTLERRLPDLEGRVFAKTGTISNVNSLSGYLVRENGQEVVFSILTNGSGLPAPTVRRAIDDIVRGLAR